MSSCDLQENEKNGWEFLLVDFSQVCCCWLGLFLGETYNFGIEKLKEKTNKKKMETSISFHFNETIGKKRAPAVQDGRCLSSVVPPPGVPDVSG